MNQILCGDCLDILKTLPDGSVHCCVTSPPYFGLRDYGVDGQIGLEGSLGEYISKLTEIFREVRRVLRDDGTLWLNLGDSYSNGGRKTRDNDDKLQSRKMDVRPDDGFKPKNLLGVPWRVAFALQDDGWYLRADIIWHKSNPLPESVSDRPTKAHEYIFLLSKRGEYYYDSIGVREPQTGNAHSRGRGVNPKSKRAGLHVRSNPSFHSQTNKLTKLPNGRNKRSVWTVPLQPYSGSHFATFPEALIEPCIKAGCPEQGIVLDPFFGSGTTGLVALKQNRQFIGIELNPEYIKLAESRVSPWINQTRLFQEVPA